jgi:DNA-binding NarL/FixJ family response regulator
VRAVQTAETAEPDVVIMDVEMPGRSGIEATGDLLASWPMIRVLIVTASVAPRTVQQAAAAGAAGYVVKTGDAELLVNAVRTVAAGGTVWPPSGPSP